MPRFLIILAVSLSIFCVPLKAQNTDSEQLAHAIDYFQSGKYHEALLLFERLSEKHRLNNRFIAYMGVCAYYEMEYEKACQYLDPTLESLEIFAPHERSVYYFTSGESHFQLYQWAEALEPYEKALEVCHDNEKGEISFRLGCCYLFLGNMPLAYEHLGNALEYYSRFANTQQNQARIEQISQMVMGLYDYLHKK